MPNLVIRWQSNPLYHTAMKENYRGTKINMTKNMKQLFMELLKLTIKLEPFKHLGNKNHLFQWNKKNPWNNNFEIYEHLGVPKPMVFNWNHDFSCQKRQKVMQIMAGNDTGIVPAHEDLWARGNSGERRLIHPTGEQLMRSGSQPCWVTHSISTAEIVLT